MPIDIKEYQILERFEGNGVNKIYKVKKISSEEIYVMKIIEIKNLKTQL